MLSPISGKGGHATGQAGRGMLKGKEYREVPQRGKDCKHNTDTGKEHGTSKCRCKWNPSFGEAEGG